MKDKVDVLMVTPLFAGLPRIDLARLVPDLEVVENPAGALLFRKGEYGDSLLVILEGQVRVFIEDETGNAVDLAFLGPNECLGEMALLTGEPRSASVETLTDFSAMRLSRDRFDHLLKKHHFLAVHFTRILSERIARNNESRAVQQNLSPASLTPPVSSPSLPVEFEETRVRKPSFSRTHIWIICGAAVIISLLLLQALGFSHEHIVLSELLLLAALGWGFNLLSFNVIALSLPVLAILSGASDPRTAFSGFSSSSWFLILGVLAITAAITNTGLLYRALLWIVHQCTPNYLGQTFGLVLSGLILTPVIPSADGRTVLASSISKDLIETLGFKGFSPAAVGLSLACMLGFGQLSFMFMNGNTSCLLAYGLLPQSTAAALTWGKWFYTGLPMGFTYLLLSWIAIMIVYRPPKVFKINKDITWSQLYILGPPTFSEWICLGVVLTTLVIMATQPFHNMSTAAVAIAGFLILAATSVLNDESIRRDIDWVRLLGIGALISFGTIMQQSGLTSVWASLASPYVAMVANKPYLFLIAVALLMHLLRFALPLIPAIVVAMLIIIPAIGASGIHPFVVTLVILASSNPWFLPYQSTVYQSLVKGSENRLFSHKQTLVMAYLQVLIIIISILISLPFWQGFGMLQ